MEIVQLSLGLCERALLRFGPSASRRGIAETGGSPGEAKAIEAIRSHG